MLVPLSLASAHAIPTLWSNKSIPVYTSQSNLKFQYNNLPAMNSMHFSTCLRSIYMDITGIDLFKQNVTCANVRLTCSWILPVLIYLIKMWVWHVPMLDSDVHRYHWYWFIWSKCGYGKIAVRLRCSWISLALIYLIKMWVWHVPMLDSDVHVYHWYWFIWSKCGYCICQLGWDVHGYQ